MLWLRGITVSGLSVTIDHHCTGKKDKCNEKATLSTQEALCNKWALYIVRLKSTYMKSPSAVFPSDISPRTSTIRLSDIFSRSVYLCQTWLCVPHQHFSTNSSLAWLLLSQLPCPTACNDHSLCNNSVANGFTCSMGLAWFCTEWL